MTRDLDRNGPHYPGNGAAHSGEEREEEEQEEEEEGRVSRVTFLSL